MNTDFWNSKRVFVTGGSGLVGARLIELLLRRDAHVVVLMRDWDPQSELIRSGHINRTSVVNGCLEDYPSLERALIEHDIDTVFHLGAQTIVGAAYRAPLATFEANIRGSYNLLEACRIVRSTVQRVLIASSDKAYGAQDVLPYSECMPPLGRHPYDVSKSCTDLIAQTYFHTYELPVVIARCGNIFGPGDLNWSRLIPGTIASLYRGEQPVVRSDGLYKRDYVYLDDAVGAYLLMAERAQNINVTGEAFNFGMGQPSTVLEIIDRLRSLMDRCDLSPIIKDQACAEIRDQYLDSAKACAVLGWRPTFTLDEALALTIEWYVCFLREQNEPFPKRMDSNGRTPRSLRPVAPSVNS